MNPAQDYILKSPEPFKGIMLQLDALILQHFPEMVLLYKWHLPFYYYHNKMCCFFNVRKSYLDLGIPYAAFLTDFQEFLIDGEKRKMLRSLRFYEESDINSTLIVAILEAQIKYVNKNS